MHRAARLAHARCRPYLEIFAYLLSRGADPAILTFTRDRAATGGAADEEEQSEDPLGVGFSPDADETPLSVFDVATPLGLGWRPGRLRARLRALAAEHASVPKAPAFVYDGPWVGPLGLKLARAWAATAPDAFADPPGGWVPHPGWGFEGAELGAARPAARAPWRPAGDADGGCFERPGTPAEVAARDAAQRRAAGM